LPNSLPDRLNPDLAAFDTLQSAHGQDTATRWFVLFVALLFDPLALVLLLAATAPPNKETITTGVV
jgi:hypothetical protein